MKAITLTQPWATLIAIGAKKIETRSWQTRYRGPLAIHAAKTFTPQDVAWSQTDPFKSVLASAGYTEFSQLPRGSIIATCNLVSICGTYEFGWGEVREPYRRRTFPTVFNGTPYKFDLSDQEESFGDYSIGRAAWLLADVQKLPKPVPARGALGLWEWAGAA